MMVSSSQTIIYTALQDLLKATCHCYRSGTCSSSSSPSKQGYTTTHPFTAPVTHSPQQSALLPQHQQTQSMHQATQTLQTGVHRFGGSHHHKSRIPRPVIPCNVVLLPPAPPSSTSTCTKSLVAPVPALVPDHHKFAPDHHKFGPDHHKSGADHYQSGSLRAHPQPPPSTATSTRLPASTTRPPSTSLLNAGRNQTTRADPPSLRNSSQRPVPRSVVRKELHRQRTPHSQVSDSRCIRRMLTGSAPVNATVECFAAPELQQQRCHQVVSSSSFQECSSQISSFQLESSVNSSQSEHHFNNNQGSFSSESLQQQSATTITSRTPSHGSTSELARRNSTSSSSAGARTSGGFTPPKWRPAGSTSSTSSSSSSGCKTSDGSSCIPRPAELRVTRRVGVDGVVIAWNPLDHDCIAGFQVVVAGKVVQLVKSPHRTKALITGLPMTTSCTIGLISVGIDGRCSKPAVVTCDRSSVYSSRSLRRAAPTRRTAVPTCI